MNGLTRFLEFPQDSLSSVALSSFDLDWGLLRGDLRKRLLSRVLGWPQHNFGRRDKSNSQTGPSHIGKHPDPPERRGQRTTITAKIPKQEELCCSQETETAGKFLNEDDLSAETDNEREQAFV